jgi:CHAD domain-containing protein
VSRIIVHDPGVRLGDDPEHVHQARVGTRRLRSDLRTFWRLLDPRWAGAVRAELGWLAAALGAVRDADVLTGRLRGQILSLASVDSKGAAGLLRRLATQREEARVQLLAVLDSDRYVALLENLVDAAAHPPLVRSEAEIAPPLPDTVAAPGATPVAAPPVGRPDPAGNGGRHVNGAATGPPGSTVALPAGGSISTVLVAVTGPPALPAPASGTTSPRPPPAAAGANPPAEMAGPPVPAASQLPPSELANQPAADVLVPLVRRPWRHLRSAVDQLGDDPPDESLHEVRIRAKRLRYAAEAVAGVIGKPARQMAAAVAEVQAVLGDMQDAVVAEGWLRRQAASSSPSQALVAGELITLQRQEQEACRQSWAKPWKRASKKSLRRWL